MQSGERIALTIAAEKSILRKMASRRRRPKIGKTGCLFWLFILLIIIVIFVFRGKGNLKETFSFLKKNEEKQEVEEKRGEEAATDILSERTSPLEEETEKEKHGVQPELSRDAEEKSSTDIAPETGTGAHTATGDAKKDVRSADEKPAAERSAIRTKKLNTTLYFVKISEDGASVQPVSVQRTIEYKDSPITRTIESLLSGPTSSERQKGITSFIPKDTKLLSARISSGHLTLNFNDRFEQNYTGREAIMLELAQVLFTAFTFDQVNRLTILINGETKRYITGEGIPLKDSYTREDLAAAGTQR
jgi:spore germination protein GerM